MLGSGPKKPVVGKILRFFFENLLLAGEMLKIASLDVLLAGEMLKIASLDVLLAGEMLKIVSLDVLLAGEMLKSAKPTFSIPQWERFFGGYVLLAGEMLKLFRNCASGWGNSKKLKLLKNGGNHVCAQGIDTQTWFPPLLTFLLFFEFPQPDAHFRKSFNISPARSTYPPQKKRSHWGNVKSWFCTFNIPQPEAHFQKSF